MIPAEPPDPTPDYDALTPLPGESALDALARVGDSIVASMAGPVAHQDPSRKPSKMPAQLAALVALRAEGYDNHEIADKLKVTTRTLRNLIAKARKLYGWSDLDHQIADVAVPMAVENVIKHLEHEGTKTALKKGQSAVTLKTLTGTGLYRSHSAVKQESTSETTNVLRVEIVLPTLPAGVSMPPLAPGSVLATPRRTLPDIPITPSGPTHAEIP